MPRLSMISMTPMCTIPLAPPPESTSAVPCCVQLCAASGEVKRPKQSAAPIATRAQLTLTVRDTLALVVVFAQLRGADRILAKLSAHAVDGARDRAVALRLQRRRGIREERELRRLGICGEPGECDADEARGSAAARTQRMQELARHPIDHAIGDNGLGKRAPRLSNGEVRILDLHTNRARGEQLGAQIRRNARDEREQLA